MSFFTREELEQIRKGSIGGQKSQPVQSQQNLQPTYFSPEELQQFRTYTTGIQTPQKPLPEQSQPLLGKIGGFAKEMGGFLDVIGRGVSRALPGGTAEMEASRDRQTSATNNYTKTLSRIKDSKRTDIQRQRDIQLAKSLEEELRASGLEVDQTVESVLNDTDRRKFLGATAELGLLAATGGVGRLAGLTKLAPTAKTGVLASKAVQPVKMGTMTAGQVGRAAGVTGLEGAAFGGAAYTTRADDVTAKGLLTAMGTGGALGGAIPVVGAGLGRGLQRRADNIARQATKITPQNAQGKAAAKILDATNTADYRGSLTDNLSSFFRGLSGALEETAGGRFIYDYYEKVVGGIANRDAMQKVFARNINANLRLSNRVKRKIGADVGELLRRAPDEDIINLTPQQLAKKYSKSVEVANAAKVSRTHFQEIIENTNVARLQRGDEAIPVIDQYLPQWVRKRGADRAGAGRGYATADEAFNPFAQERVPGMTEAMRRMTNRDIQKNSAKQLAKKFDIPEDLAKKIKSVELNPFNSLDQYHRYAANEIELTPVVQSLNKLADDIAETNPAGSKWLREYVSTNISKTTAAKMDDALGITGGSLRQRALQRLSLARSLSGLVGNPAWMLFTQPQTLFVAGGKFGPKNLVRGLLDYATSPALRKEIKSLPIYRLKRSGSIGTTAGGQLDRVSDSVLKTRREFANDLMTIGSNFIEQQLDAISAATARRAALQYVKKGKMTQEGIRNFMNFGIESTQSVYAAEMRSQLLSNLSIRAAFPFQTYSNEMFRHLKNLSTGKSAGFRLTATQRAVQATNLVIMMMLGNELQKKVTGRQLTSPGSVVPFAGGLLNRGIDEVTSRTGLPDTQFAFDDSVSITAFESDFKQVYQGIKKFVENGDERQLRRALVRWGTGLSGIGGAAGINRLLDTADAWNREYLRYGDEKVPFDRSARNLIQGSVTGPWTTPQAKQFLSGNEQEWELRSGLMEQITRNTTGDFSRMIREDGSLSNARQAAREHNRKVDGLMEQVKQSSLSEERKKKLLESLKKEKVSEKDYALESRLKK
jgi:hypothetical protein